MRRGESGSPQVLETLGIKVAVLTALMAARGEQQEQEKKVSEENGALPRRSTPSDLNVMEEGKRLEEESEDGAAFVKNGHRPQACQSER